MALVTFDRDDVSPIRSRFEFEPRVGQRLAKWEDDKLVTATIEQISHAPDAHGDYGAVVHCRVESIEQHGRTG